MQDSKKKVSISLSEGVLLSIDKHARLQGLSRSAYITKLENDEIKRNNNYIRKYENTDYYSLPVCPESMSFED